MMPIETVMANITQSCLLGGISRTESSLTRNLVKFVLTGVLNEPPSGNAWTVEPCSFAVASRTWTSRGRCSLKIKTTRGRLHIPPDSTIMGSESTIPMMMNNEAYIRKKAGNTVPSMLK